MMEALKITMHSLCILSQLSITVRRRNYCHFINKEVAKTTTRDSPFTCYNPSLHSDGDFYISVKVIPHEWRLKYLE